MEIEDLVHQQFSISMLQNGCKQMRKQPGYFKVDVKAKTDNSGELLLSFPKPRHAISKVVNKIIEAIDNLNMSIVKTSRTEIKLKWSTM